MSPRFKPLSFLAAWLLFHAASPVSGETFAPPLSSHYQVEVAGKTQPVFTTPVLRGEPVSFSAFDLSAPARVIVTAAQPIKTFKILPESKGLQATASGNQIIFTLSQPANLTLELNGTTNETLHLFAKSPDPAPPDPQDPKVIYFAPGFHRISTLRPKDGQTIYLATGAFLRAFIPPGEKAILEREGKQGREKLYSPVIEGNGVNNVRIRGGGILDLGALPWHSRKAIWFEDSSNLLIEGITLLDAPDWALALHKCSDSVIRNIQQISARENGDGIDLSNSRNILVEDCFIRSNDDAISVKTLSPPPAPASQNIVVRRCVIWNERARALGITSETRADISGILFEDCDILHDLSEGGDCAALAILVSDSASIRNIRFENIRIEDCRTKWLRCWIGQDGWAQDKTRGHLADVVFKNISISGKSAPLSEIMGFDSGHIIENVFFENLTINGKKIGTLPALNLKTNPHVKNIRMP